MHRPRLTRELVSESCAPACPHCGADCDGAMLALGEICRGLPLDDFIRVDHDGFAEPNRYLEANCPACGRPFAVRIGEDEVILVACRTETDRRYLQERVA